MEEGNKKNIVIGVVAGVLLIVVGVWFFGGKNTAEKGASVPKGPDVFRPENPKALPTIEGGTREALKEKIETPEVGAEPKSADVAVPMSVSQIGTAAGRTFEIKGENGAFSPNTIVVNEFDIITVSLSAVDAEYSISFPDFGIYWKVEKNSSARRQFQAYPFGEYVFSCSDVCKTPVLGKLIVNKK